MKGFRETKRTSDIVIGVDAHELQAACDSIREITSPNITVRDCENVYLTINPFRDEAGKEGE